MIPAAIAALLLVSPSRASEGLRFPITDGTLFIPADVGCRSAAVPLLIHLHGAQSVVEENLKRASLRAILVDVTLPGLSGVYTDRFRDSRVFPRILQEVDRALGTRGVGSITVSSFSAGFGGVRELLANPESFDRIDALVMADSIYAGYSGDPALKKVNPENMKGFLRFAREAAAGRKQMMISHTDLIPNGYASTGETADYLISMLGGKREVRNESWPGELNLQSYYRKGKLEILGFAGTTGADHMKHLRNLGLFLRRIRPAIATDMSSWD